MALASVTTFLQERRDVARALVEAVHAALVEVLQVPPDDPTVWARMIPGEDSIVAGRHGCDAVVVEITMFSGRTDQTVARLHRQVCDRVASVGIDPLCVINESPARNWSIGGVPQDTVDVGFQIDI